MASILNAADGKAARLLLTHYGKPVTSTQRLNAGELDAMRRDIQWIVTRLIERRVSIGQKTFTTAVDVFRQHGSYGNARQMFDKMRAVGVLPDNKAYDAVLSACVVDPTHFHRYLEEKRKAGFGVSGAELFLHLQMLSFTKMGARAGHSVAKEMEEVLAAAAAGGVTPDAYHYAKVFLLCDTLKSALALLRASAMRQALLENSNVLLALMKVAAREGNVSRTEHFAKRLKTLKMGEPIVHTRTLALALRKAGSHIKSEKVWLKYDDALLTTPSHQPYGVLDVAERLANLAYLPPNGALLTHAWKVFLLVDNAPSGGNARGADVYEAMAMLLKTYPPETAGRSARRLQELMQKRQAVPSVVVRETLAALLAAHGDVAVVPSFTHIDVEAENANEHPNLATLQSDPSLSHEASLTTHPRSHEGWSGDWL